MEDRVNQQKIVSDAEIGWLAGFLEGDGFITMSAQKAAKKKKDGGLVVVPKIGFCNSDALLIEKAKNICQKISGGGCWINESKCGTYPTSTLTMLNLTVTRLSACQKILESIIPHLGGQKIARARLLLDFINKRLSHSHCPYDSDEIGLIKTFILNHVDKTKGPYRGKALLKFLNDYTPDMPRPRNESGRFTSAA